MTTFWIVVAVVIVGFAVNFPKCRKPLSEDDGNWFYGAVFYRKGVRFFQFRSQKPLSNLHSQGYFGVPWLALIFYNFLWPWRRPSAFYWFKILWHSLTAGVIALTVTTLWGNPGYGLFAGIFYNVFMGLSHSTWSDLTYAEVFLPLPLCISIIGMVTGGVWGWIIAGIFAGWAVQIKMIAIPLVLLLPIAFLGDTAWVHYGLFLTGGIGISILPALLILLTSPERKGGEISDYFRVTFGPLFTAARLILGKFPTSSAPAPVRVEDDYTARKWQSAGSLKQQWKTVRDRFQIDWAIFRPLFLLALFALLLPDRFVALFAGLFLVFMLVLFVQKSYYLPKFGFIWFPLAVLAGKSTMDIIAMCSFHTSLYIASVILLLYYIIRYLIKIVFEYRHAHDLAGFPPNSQTLFQLAQKIGAYLRQNAQPNDRLLVWGNFANLYLYSGLECMNSSYLFLYPNRVLQEDIVRRNFRDWPAPEWLVWFNYHTRDDWNFDKIRAELMYPVEPVAQFGAFPVGRRNDAHYAEILVDRAQHESERAMEYLSHAQRVRPDDHELELRLYQAEHGALPEPPDGSYADRKLYAIALYQEGRYEEAQELLGQLLIERQDDFRVLLYLGGLYFVQGDAVNAFKAFKKCIELFPFSAECFNDMGVVLSQLQDHENARACFEKALKLYPDYVEARQNLQAIISI